MVLAAVSVVDLAGAGKGGDLMDTMGGKYQSFKGGQKCLTDMVEDLEEGDWGLVLEETLLPGLM